MFTYGVLESITFGTGIKSFDYDSYMFLGCPLSTVKYSGTVDDWAAITFASSKSNPISGKSEFYVNGELLTDVVFSDSLTSINSVAFYGYKGQIESVTIPKSVTSIGGAAFGNCNITNLYYEGTADQWMVTGAGSGLTSSAENVYFDGKLATDIVLSDGITSIPDNAFYGLAGMTSISVPDSVTSIGANAFAGCTGLTSVDLPDALTTIGNSAFEGCTGLTSVDLSDALTTISDSAFEGCTGLSAVEIPASVTEIGSYAFKECTAVSSVTIPSSVTYIKTGAFENCNSLTDVYYTGTLSDWLGIRFISSAANPMCYAETLYINGEKVTELVLPDGITAVNSYAFNSCKQLVSVTIPESVTSIGTSSFSGCENIKRCVLCGQCRKLGANRIFFELVRACHSASLC